MNNTQLARAIGALYRLTNGGDGDWTGTDEAIQQAAFLLWEKSDARPEEMAVMLAQYSPLDVPAIADFLDISDERVSAAIAEDDARKLRAIVAELDAQGALEDGAEW